MTTDAFEAWDEAGSYSDWRAFDALTKNEQFFLCWQAATLAERERAARACEQAGLVACEMYGENKDRGMNKKQLLNEAAASLDERDYDRKIERANEAAQTPAWHDAPTMPGLWLNSINQQSERVSQLHIDVGVFDRTHARWLGPIPEDKP